MVAAFRSFLFQKVPVLSWLSARTDHVNFRSLALFRIFFALILLHNYFFSILPDYQIFYGPQGIIPSDLWHEVYKSPGYFTLFVLSDSALYHAALQAVYVLALLAFLIGWRTRWANIIVLVIFASFFWRNFLLNTNADVLIRTFLLLSVFLPLNRYWAFDAALEIKDRHRPHYLIPLVAVKIQISLIYLFSGLFKLPAKGSSWTEGTAVGMALRDDFYSTALGGALVEAFPAMAALASFIVPAFQVAFVFLVYSPFFNNLTRLAALIGAALMHISFIVFMYVGYFPFVCLAYLVLLVPDEWWDRFRGRKRERLSRIRIFYDPDCVFCKKIALLFREFCLHPSVPVLPSSADEAAHALLQEHNSWVVYGADGQVYLKWRAVSYILRQSLLFRPLGWLSDLGALRPAMTRLYDCIGRNRGGLGRATAGFLSWRNERPHPAAFNGFCIIVVSVLILYSFMTLPQAAAKPPRWLATAARTLQVQQKWNIFAPSPTDVQRQITLTAHMQDGRKTDLAALTDMPLRYDAEKKRWDVKNQRWIKFFVNVTKYNKREKYRAAYMDYLCRAINGREIQQNKVVKIEFTYEGHNTGLKPDRKPRRLHQVYDCPVNVSQK